MTHLINRMVLVVGLLVVMALPAMAQDDVETIPEDLSGFYIVSFEGGTLELADGEGTLTLNNIPGLLPWILDAPTTYAGRIDTLLFLLGWGGSPAMPVATGLLETDTAIYELSISAPEFDVLTSSLSARVVVERAFNLTDEATEEAMSAFSEGTLFIEFDATFEAALVEGASSVTDDMRVIRTPTTSNPRPPVDD